MLLLPWLDFEMNLYLCRLLAHATPYFAETIKNLFSQICIWHTFHYGFCELNTVKVMKRNLNLNGLYATLAHHLNKGILLAQLLVKVVNLCFKLLYLRAQLCYKRLVISNWTW